MRQFQCFGNVSTISNLKWKSCWAIAFSENTVLFRISKQKLDLILQQCQTPENVLVVKQSFKSLNANDQIAKRFCYYFDERVIAAGSLLVNS